MPDTYERYQMFEKNFRDNYFWKCVEEKEVMKTTLRLEAVDLPDEKDLIAVQAKIIAL
jgi:hypothetical protein